MRSFDYCEQYCYDHMLPEDQLMFKEHMATTDALLRIADELHELNRNIEELDRTVYGTRG